MVTSFGSLICKEKYEPLWIKGGKHCHLESHSEYIKHLKKFISAVEKLSIPRNGSNQITDLSETPRTSSDRWELSRKSTGSREKSRSNTDRIEKSRKSVDLTEKGRNSTDQPEEGRKSFGEVMKSVCNIDCFKDPESLEIKNDD